MEEASELLKSEASACGETRLARQMINWEPGKYILNRLIAWLEISKKC
jgi:hypothetical protein